MKFYRACMQNASVILFWSAVALFFASLLVSFALNLQMFSGQANVVMTPSNGMVWELLSAIVSALGNAVWPFFGAGLLWTIDRKLPAKGVAE